MNRLTLDHTVDPITHSPSPYPLPPVGHPCLSGNWGPTSQPCRTRRMDALDKRAGVI